MPWFYEEITSNFFPNGLILTATKTIIIARWLLIIYFDSPLENSAAAAAAKSLQSCPTLCDPIDGSSQGSHVPGILQARMLEWVAIYFSNMKVKNESEVSQSCLTLSHPMDYSLPGSSVHGIFQATVLEWVSISFSRRSSRPRDWTGISCVVGRCFTVWATRELLLEANIYF